MESRSSSSFVDVEPFRRWALIVGLAGAALCAVGWMIDAEQFYRSYLVGWLLWLCVALGCYAILLIQFLAPGRWGMIMRRSMEAASRTLPLLALLFVPLALGLGSLYLWADPEAVAADELLQHKRPYLNSLGFLFRAALYFAIWIGGALLIARLSRRQDDSEDPELPRKLRSVAAPALGLYALAATFASFDWIMSLDPHWFSSIFGVYFIVGHGVAGFAFLITLARFLSEREPLSRHFETVHFHDYGKFLFAFVMLWAYIAVSQYLIIWSGNLPEEITWPLERGRGGWDVLTVLLVMLQFFFPFLLLLSAGLKKNIRRLVVIAAALLVVRWLDLYWMAAPSFHEQLTIHWLDLATVVAVGGLWLAFFLTQLRNRPLLALGDPAVREAFGHE